MRMRLVIAVLGVGLSTGACDEAGPGPGPGSASSDHPKGDEFDPAAPIHALSTGQTVSGDAAGSAVSLYLVQARPRSVIEATAERTDGDLDPKVFLYSSVFAAQSHDFMAPTHGFDNGDDSLTAGWEIPSFGASGMLLVVSASGETSGRFSLSLRCHEDSPVPCTENGEQDELDTCEFVREAFARCDADEDDCDDFLSIEDTTQEEECCELWEANGLPLEDFCP